MKQKLLLPCFLVLLATAIFSTAQSVENAAIEREEYAVYSAMIADYVYEETGIMVIVNPTSHGRYETKLKDFRFFHYRDPVPALLQETLDDFLQRNKSNRWLTPKLEINRKYVLVDFREIKRLTSDFNSMVQERSAFFKEYPASHGFIDLSRVGFNRQMDQALVHIGFRCPGLCGHWSFLLLTKKDGIWKVVGEANREVS